MVPLHASGLSRMALLAGVVCPLPSTLKVERPNDHALTALLRRQELRFQPGEWQKPV